MLSHKTPSTVESLKKKTIAIIEIKLFFLVYSSYPTSAIWEKKQKDIDLCLIFHTLSITNKNGEELHNNVYERLRINLRYQLCKFFLILNVTNRERKNFKELCL